MLPLANGLLAVGAPDLPQHVAELIVPDLRWEKWRALHAAGEAQRDRRPPECVQVNLVQNRLLRTQLAVIRVLYPRLPGSNLFIQCA